MSCFHYDLCTTLKSIDHKLSGVECRLVALDNKFDLLEKKMVDVFLRCLDKQSIPYLWEQSENLLQDIDSKPLHQDTNFEQKVKFETDILNDETCDMESRDYSPNTTQEIIDDFELISLQDGSIQEEQEELNSSILDLDSSQKPTKLRKNREYGKLNRFLDTLSNRLKQNENHRKLFQTSMNLFTSGLMKKLRAFDKLFDKMYGSLVMSGNYFDSPTDLNYNEYNLTVILKPPVDKENTVNIVQKTNKRGYCRLTATVDADDIVAQEFNTKFVNRDNFLRVNEFYEWFERIIKQYFTSSDNKLEIAKKNYEYLTFVINRLDKSTTGTIIHIHVPSENIRFSVDIGVGMEFERKHAYCDAKIPQIIGTETWIATAKYDTSPDCLEWLCSFYSIERKILQDKVKAVPLIRIFKQFFNATDMPSMNTYLIENIFLSEIAKKEDAKQTEFWTSSSLASLFIHMFDIILQCLNKHSIPYYWDESINLLHDVDSRRMHDTLIEQNMKLGKEITNSSTCDLEPNFDAIFYNKEALENPQELMNMETSKKSKKGPNASQVLEQIGSFIQVTDRKEYIQHYNAVMKFFINQLKSDDTFKLIFKRQEMAGSYRDGLKISIPNEYDTILQLNFGSNFLVERIFNQPTHCTIKVINYDAKAKPHLQQFMDSEEYLLQDEISIWFQKLFSRILKPLDQNGKTFQIEGHSYQYKFSINGPAFTFKITVLECLDNQPIKFDMDLVPAISFGYTHWVATRSYQNTSNQVSWIAVPKPPKGDVIRKNRSFTCSYTEMEKFVFHGMKQTKNIIRIFKKLRDNQQLKDLKSYYIKTIFLWQFDETTIQERDLFWSRSMEIIFVDMFKIILNHIQNRELNFYWEPSYNMFTTIAESKLKSWDDKLRGIYARLETVIAENPKGLIDIILNQEEKKLIESKHKATLCIVKSVL